jgi:N-acetylneuraminate synthase
MAVSIEPSELAELIKGSRAIWEARGGEKTVLANEQPVIDFAYASVVSIAPLRRGELFSDKNTWVKRPGNGPLRAADLESVIGRAASRDIPAGVQIQPSDLA